MDVSRHLGYLLAVGSTTTTTTAPCEHSTPILRACANRVGGVTAKIISAFWGIAWPILVAGAAFMFRAPLATLISKISEIDSPEGMELLVTQQSATAAAMAKGAVANLGGAGSTQADPVALAIANATAVLVALRAQVGQRRKVFTAESALN